jgi:hypothetical protein
MSSAWGLSFGAAWGSAWGALVGTSRPVVFSRVPLADDPFFDYNRQRREDDSLLLLLL